MAVAMFEPAAEGPCKKYDSKIDKDLEELKQMWLEVEKWPLELAADELDVKLTFHKDDDTKDDDGGGRCLG
jgi:hypothetical protein